MTARRVPHDLDAEDAVLGACFVYADDEAFMRDVAQTCEPDDFYRPSNAYVFQEIIRRHRNGLPITPNQVAATDEDRSEAELVTLITEAPSRVTAMKQARLVASHANRRRAIGFASELAEQAFDTGVPVDDVVAAASQFSSYLRPLPDQGGRRSVDGSSFILNAPTSTPAVWGERDEVAWAKGEPLVIAAPQGVGKTTIAGQLVRASLGITKDVIGMPVTQAKRVLYIAADRPEQAQRSMRRQFRDEDAETLRDRLVVWKGPLPFNIVADSQALASFCSDLGVDRLFIDSLKDIAVGLTKDEVGAAVNIAFQTVVASGVDLGALHHQRKAQAGAGPPKTLDDVYGSTWITSGVGSVLLLWGEAGDAIVDLFHLKQPAEPVGPLKLVHDHITGNTTVMDRVDVLQFVNARGNGTSVYEVATAMFGEQPKANLIEQARRKLDGLVKRGLLDKQDGERGGRPATYFSKSNHEVNHDTVLEEGITESDANHDDTNITPISQSRIKSR